MPPCVVWLAMCTIAKCETRCAKRATRKNAKREQEGDPEEFYGIHTTPEASHTVPRKDGGEKYDPRCQGCVPPVVGRILLIRRNPQSPGDVQELLW
jgi:hypothetical protein